MPTYEYECRACGYTFERTQNMSDEPIRVCPKCGKDVRRLIFGGSGVIFKGSGFYVNDSRGKKSNAVASVDAKKQSTDGSSQTQASSQGDTPASASAASAPATAPAASGGLSSAPGAKDKA